MLLWKTESDTLYLLFYFLYIIICNINNLIKKKYYSFGKPMLKNQSKFAKISNKFLLYLLLMVTIDQPVLTMLEPKEEKELNKITSIYNIYNL
jgi:NADH:ubiquinone oxidoreductase subunit 3 (subunit A)